MGKQVLFYLSFQTIVYTVICGTGWHWALGLQFEIWKLPIVGLAHAVLTLFGSGLHRHIFRESEKPEAFEADT